MKRLAIAAFAAVIGLGLASFDADAKRLGGGKSSGMSRDSSVTNSSAVPAKPAASPQSTAPAAGAAAAAAPKPGMSRWLGPLAGLAAGIGLAALFSHLGLGEGMANIFMMLILAAVAVFAIRWFMNRNRAPALQHAGASPLAGNYRFEPTPAPSAPLAKVGADGTAGNYLAASGAPQNAQVPAGFDVEGFVRQAKLNFIRLQAANDRGDMDDIRQFTAPEMFAEIQMQHKERGQKPQETDVMELEAELLDVSTENSRYVASVRFYGRIREEAHAAPEAFAEVWHLVKPVDGSTGWLIAGIQQS